jgi:uncharacterized protein
MLFTVIDLQREPIDFQESLPPGVIDFTEDIRQSGHLVAQGRADLLHEHRGPNDVVEDIRIRANASTRLELACARCLEPVTIPVATSFDLIFRPGEADAGSADRAISTSETEIGYYEGDGLLLEDVLREQILLALPARVLCRDSCKGLCPACGRNRNTDPCDCDALPSDPRWAALQSVRVQQKP